MIDKLKAAEEKKIKELQKKLEDMAGSEQIGVISKID